MKNPMTKVIRVQFCGGPWDGLAKELVWNVAEQGDVTVLDGAPPKSQWTYARNHDRLLVPDVQFSLRAEYEARWNALTDEQRVTVRKACMGRPGDAR